MPEDRLAELLAAGGTTGDTGPPPLLGPYRILARLGAGGMGTVYRAEGPAGIVAIKVVHPHLLATHGVFKRFLREAEIGMTVDHGNVVRTMEADAIALGDQTLHFLVMEFVEGQTTQELLGELGRVSEELCRHIGREAAAGLAAIHAAGAVHRDLKPSNLLITADHAVKIMDLGVAMLADGAARLSQTGTFLGSVAYAAPEQFGVAAAGPLDHRADLYGLGGVLYELCAGEPAFPERDQLRLLQSVLHEDPPRLSRKNPQVSPFLEEVVHKLLAKKPDDRFADAAEVLSVLEAGEASAWWKQRVRDLREQTARPLRRIRVPRETAIHGREEELGLLRTLFDRAAAGDGQVLLLEGEAGIGKSRLVDEFAGMLEAEAVDFDFLFGSYPPGGAATPAGAFSTAYVAHLGAADLEASLGELLSDAPSLVPAFAGLLNGVPALGGASPLDRDAAIAGFIGVTKALAARRPLLILIDDLHFAPEQGLALFAALSLAVPAHRVLLVGTFRPGMPGSWVADVERLEHAQRAELRRLGPKDLIRLLNDAFRSPKLADELGARIALKSDGNPFFVFEIVRGLREGGYIKRSETGDWSIAREVRELEIPSSVLDLILARVTALDDEEREILDVAACIGFEFSPGLAVDVAGLPRVPGLRLLARIERRHRLVRSVGPKYVFDHHQVHQALYRDLPEPLVEEYHAAIARELQRSIGDGEDDAGSVDGRLAAEICDHHVRSRHGELAEPWLLPAVEHLRGASRHPRALTLLRGALSEGAGRDPADRADLLLPAAEIEMLLGHPDPARGLYEEALGLAEDLPDPERLFRALTGLADVLQHLGEVEEARRSLERAAAVAEESGVPRLRGSAALVLGSLLHRLGEPDRARESYEKALGFAEAAEDPGGTAKATGNLGLLAWEAGELPRARELLEEALTTFQKVGERRSEASVIGMLGLVLDEMGLYREAASMHERQLEICRGIGYRRGVAISTSNLGDSLRLLGRLGEASERFAEAERISAEIGDATGVMTARLNHGPVLRELGRHRECRRQLLRAVREARALEEKRSEGTALYQLAIVHQHARRPGRALRLVRRARRLLSEVGYRAGEVWAALLAGSALLDLGREKEGREVLERAAAEAAEIELPQLAALVSTQLARAGALSVATAEERLTENLERLSPHERVEAFHALWKGSGDQRHLARARENLATLIAGVPPEGIARFRSGWWIAREIEGEEETQM